MAEEAGKTEKVLVRVKRMGAQWATCGIGILPPAKRLDEHGIYDKCTKLVPGQCVRLPISHPLVGHHLTEVVRRPEEDEFIRPWVFDSAEHAALGDPSKQQLGADQIANGLAMFRGAVAKQEADLQARKQAALDYEQDNHDEDDDNEPGYRKSEPVDEDDDFRDPPRSASRERPDIYKDAQPKRLADEDEPEAEPAPVRRGRRSRG